MIVHRFILIVLYRKDNWTSDLHTCTHSRRNTEIKRNEHKWTNTEVQCNKIIYYNVNVMKGTRWSKTFASLEFMPFCISVLHEFNLNHQTSPRQVAFHMLNGKYRYRYLLPLHNQMCLWLWKNISLWRGCSGFQQCRKVESEVLCIQRQPRCRQIVSNKRNKGTQNITYFNKKRSFFFSNVFISTFNAVY